MTSHLDKLIQKAEEIRAQATQGEWEADGRSKKETRIVVKDGDWDGGYFPCATAYHLNKEGNPDLIIFSANHLQDLLEIIKIQAEALNFYGNPDNWISTEVICDPDFKADKAIEQVNLIAAKIVGE